MAATVTRTPAHPGSDGGNPNSRTNSAGTNCVQQDPGQESGSSSSHPQHPVFTRPVFYVHAPPPPPPPPPFLQYQWPMPFSYNPFAGFPAMSYGMVVPPPPLPPPPFMEAPAYFLPHPHMQPVDYRRLTHPGPHQHPNQMRRIRQPHTNPVRETVNSEVQTEPTQRRASVYNVGWQAAGSDSGRGTASSSPCSSSSSSQKRASVEVVNYKLPNSDGKDHQVNEPCTSSIIEQGFDKYPPAGEPCTRASQQMQMDKDVVGRETPVLPPCRDGHIWVSSPDGMVPVCSSSQEDGVFKERRVSVPDILMGWGADAPQAMLKVADGELLGEHQQSHELEAETYKSVYQSLTKNPPDGPLLFKILRLPCAFIGPFSDSKGGANPAESTCRDEEPYSPNLSQKFPDNEQENVTGTDLHEYTTEIIPSKARLSSGQVGRLNESVWSVESLAPFIPTRDWLLQNSMFEMKVDEMIEEDEDAELSTQNDKLTAVACQERKNTISGSESVLLSGSWLDFQTGDERRSPPKQPEMESGHPVVRRPDQDKSSSEKDPSSSPTSLEKDESLSAEEEKGSSEPEAHKSPNQKSTVELQEKSSSPEEETFLLNSPAEEEIRPLTQSGVDTEADDRGPLTVQTKAEVSPSGHLVDCGIQCIGIVEHICVCGNPNCRMEQNGKQLFKNSDLKKGNKSEAFGMNGNQHKRRNGGSWKHRGQERHNGQQEFHEGYFKPGKSKGGNGRNSRC